MKKSVLIALLLAGCQSEAQQDTAETGPAEATSNIAENQSGEAAAPAGPQTAEVGPLKIRWDASKLARTEAEIRIPPDWQHQTRGMKLVAAERLKLLETAECMYGQSGEATLCTAGKEAGLAFAIIDQPYDQLSGRLSEPPSEPITLAGREGITWKIGAEGEGADYMLLPAEDRTLLIVRQYRNSGEIDEQAIRDVLNSLSIDAD